MKNAEWMLENGMEFSKLSWGYINGRNIVYYCKDNRTVNELYAEESANPENLITKWLDMDYKEPILDDEEKRYLSAVIKPFRDSIKYISRQNADDKSFIFIRFFDDNDIDMCFPYFKKGTMYKGMEIDMRYKLEELGL